MATTTPNFGWTVPTSSDLVKNGATAIETLGDAIDASLVDLKGGTTGQVLAKASGTDMDFTWSTAGGSGGITQLASGSLSSSVDLTSISSSYKNLTLIIRNFLPTATDGAAIAFRFNNDSNSRYGMNNTGNATDINFGGNERITTNDGQDSGTSQSFIKLDLWDYTNTTTWKVFSCLTWTNNPTTSANANMRSLTGAYNQTAAISTINIFNNYGTATTGTYVLYGVN